MTADLLLRLLTADACDGDRAASAAIVRICGAEDEEGEARRVWDEWIAGSLCMPAGVREYVARGAGWLEIEANGEAT